MQRYTVYGDPNFCLGPQFCSRVGYWDWDPCFENSNTITAATIFLDVYSPLFANIFPIQKSWWTIAVASYLISCHTLFREEELIINTDVDNFLQDIRAFISHLKCKQRYIISSRYEWRVCFWKVKTGVSPSTHTHTHTHTCLLTRNFLFWIEDKGVYH